MGKILWKKDYIGNHLKEVAEMGEDHLDHQMLQGHPMQGTTTITRELQEGPKPAKNDPRQPASRQDQAPNPTEAERISEILARTMARGGRRAAQPPFKLENKPAHDVRVWTMASEDFFGRNGWQWEEEHERIKYDLSMM